MYISIYLYSIYHNTINRVKSDFKSVNTIYRTADIFGCRCHPLQNDKMIDGREVTGVINIINNIIYKNKIININHVPFDEPYPMVISSLLARGLLISSYDHEETHNVQYYSIMYSISSTLCPR